MENGQGIVHLFKRLFINDGCFPQKRIPKEKLLIKVELGVNKLLFMTKK